jgi:hypothetical protein
MRTFLQWLLNLTPPPMPKPKAKPKRKVKPIYNKR